MKDKKILIIIPAYNEEDCILNTYNNIIKYNKKNNTNYNVIVINDGSKDSTEDILLKSNVPHITLVHNLGIGGAVQTGYKYAYEKGYDVAIQFDADGQHDINYISKLIKPIVEKKYDFAIGSRFIDPSSSKFKSSFSRRLGIKIISLNTYLCTGKKILDTTSGFRACNKDIIKKFALDYPTEYPEPITNVELLKMKKKVIEIPVSMNEREGGVSSIRAWKTVYYMINVVLSMQIAALRRYK